MSISIGKGLYNIVLECLEGEILAFDSHGIVCHRIQQSPAPILPQVRSSQQSLSLIESLPDALAIAVSSRMHQVVTGQSFHIEEWFAMPDGSSKRLALKLMPWQEEGKITGGVLYVRDRTLWHLGLFAQDALSSLLDAAVFEVDVLTMRCHRWWGARLDEILLPVEEWVGASMAQLFPVSASELIDTLCAQYIESRKPQDGQIHLGPKSYALRLFSPPLSTNATRVVLAVGPLELVTAASSTEEASSISMALRHCRSELSAQSQFLRDLSADMAAPLNTVVGVAKLLQSHDDLAALDTRDSLQLLLHSAENLLDYVRDIQLWYGLLSGEVRLQAGPIDLELWSKSLRLRYLPRALEKGVELVIEVDQNVGLALMDQTFLESILENILGNALKFTEKGRIVLTLRHEVGHIQPMVYFTVTDTGSGIPEDLMDSVFEPFGGACRHAHTRFSGTGLGLAISRKMARLMGGDIRIESWPGQGTRVEVGLPQGISTLSTPVRDLWQQSLLLLSDDIQLRRLASEYFREQGCVVSSFGDGVELLATLRTARFDLVLIDVDHKAEENIQVVGALRSFDPFTPVYGLSRSISGALMAYLERSGFMGCFPKPLPVEDVLEVLRRARESAKPRS